MSGNSRRRPRGAAKTLPVVHGHVSHEAKDILATMSDVLEVSQAQVIEAILLALPLDEDGVAVLIDRSKYSRREELPIPAA